jgi:hypothetical protein
MGKTFKISCDEATTICDKNQYGEASVIEKLKLMFHLTFCDICSKYSKQNTLMTKLFGKYFTSCEEDKRMPEELKKEIEKKFLEEMEK